MIVAWPSTVVSALKKNQRGCCYPSLFVAGRHWQRLTYVVG